MTDVTFDCDPLEDAIRTALAALIPASSALDEIATMFPSERRQLVSRLSCAVATADVWDPTIRHDLQRIIEAAQADIDRGRHREVIYDPYYVEQYYTHNVLEPHAAALQRAIWPVTVLLERLQAVEHITAAERLAREMRGH